MQALACVCPLGSLSLQREAGWCYPTIWPGSSATAPGFGGILGDIAHHVGGHGSNHTARFHALAPRTCWNVDQLATKTSPPSGSTIQPILKLPQVANKIFRGTGAGTSGSSGNASASKKKEKEEPPPELTPLEKLLQNAGAVREDGSDKFFGLENSALEDHVSELHIDIIIPSYCNSIVQALYYSEIFRESVVNYPPFSPSDTPNGKRAKINKPDSPEYKKKQAMLKGPVLELAQENSASYGMDESTFTGLKDLFLALIESQSRTGVLSPQRFLEIFKRDNEMFRNSMHQDAHEFYGLVLNDVISTVEANAKRLQEQEQAAAKDGLAKSVEDALSPTNALVKAPAGYRSPGTGWVHDIFEGLLTSETRCLTCETASQRDETFLDLSIDLDEHSSVTSCLRKFSAEEMLCERNKFHCDHCGGLQEAEKRMKIKRLPKVLALHLKRFKYTEDYSRLQKLFHRVVYPYHLRMFNTTPDAEDPDRVYELYAVVVHIGGNAYHGHYVSVIKTADRGWLLFDDEMVEPVDKHFVRNFFGDRPGMACAYVLFYQETTLEKAMEEEDYEGIEEIRLATQTADLASDKPSGAESLPPLEKPLTTPIPPVADHDAMAALDHALTAPNGTTPAVPQTPANPSVPAVPAEAPFSHPLVAAPPKPAAEIKPSSKEDKAREKQLQKEKKAAEKEQVKREEKERKERESRQREARKSEQEDLRRAMEASKQTAAEEEQKQKADNALSSKEAPTSPALGGGIGNLMKRGSLSRASLGFLNREKEKEKDKSSGNGVANGSSSDHAANGSAASPHPESPASLKKKFSFALGRKKSTHVLS
uniref:ubiquitinyl hydrolase 1 n=1 Tax=Pyricularia oryzae (strain P131) TaxID=1143193 RepID=L7IZT3_PYRO1